MSDNEIAQFRGKLLLKLLDIENSRCNSREDEDDRTDSLASVLEGEDHIIARLSKGMDKYMDLLGISPAPRSINDMMSDSVLRPNETPAGMVNVRARREEVEVWDRIKREAGRHGLNFDNVSLMNIETHMGGRSSPEDQITCTFRVLR